MQSCEIRKKKLPFCLLDFRHCQPYTEPSALYMVALNVLKVILRLSLLLLLLRLFLCQDLPSTLDSNASYVNCWDGHLHTNRLKASAPPWQTQRRTSRGRRPTSRILPVPTAWPTHGKSEHPGSQYIKNKNKNKLTNKQKQQPLNVWALSKLAAAVLRLLRICKSEGGDHCGGGGPRLEERQTKLL